MAYDNVFPDEVPHGLPPTHGIEHQIDFVPGASIPNRPAYQANPDEVKEKQRQVEDLLSKGWIHESLSPCALPVLFVPKKDGGWRMCVDCRAVNAITATGDGSSMIKFFGELQSLVKLEVGISFLQFLALGGVPQELPSKLNDLKTIELRNVNFRIMDNVNCVVSLIRSSPKLYRMTLILKVGSPGVVENG
ncbi:uncharacterized protein LOC127240867 isoform X3 [Andrographis paniculata]|uniref:uncharacterized protein LOC127240867 isoform X3 n=1 Tax=Andrographis paniculata TaxID=175694 RepID=UPI0021E82A6F|nr:uncharacterized protein LOC127240867 isoform X3 [Andrographis paniculata]